MELTGWLDGQADKLQGSARFHPSPSTGGAGHCAWLPHGAGASNSGLHAFVVGTLPTEPPPQLQIVDCLNSISTWPLFSHSTTFSGSLFPVFIFFPPGSS